jgi:rubrerythrin
MAAAEISYRARLVACASCGDICATENEEQCPDCQS